MIDNKKLVANIDLFFQNFDIQKNILNKILSKFKLYCLGFDKIPNNW